jgi:hypothetical protein
LVEPFRHCQIVCSLAELLVLALPVLELLAIFVEFWKLVGDDKPLAKNSQQKGVDGLLMGLFVGKIFLPV